MDDNREMRYLASVSPLCLQGGLDITKNTTLTPITQDSVQETLDYIFSVGEQNSGSNGISTFIDAYKTLLRVQGIPEFDRFRNEILSELFNEATEFGTTSSKQDAIINNAYSLTYSGPSQDMKVSQKMENKHSNAPKAPSLKMK